MMITDLIQLRARHFETCADSSPEKGIIGGFLWLERLDGGCGAAWSERKVSKSKRVNSLCWRVFEEEVNARLVGRLAEQRRELPREYGDGLLAVVEYACQ